MIDKFLFLIELEGNLDELIFIEFSGHILINFFFELFDIFLAGEHPG